MGSKKRSYEAPLSGEGALEEIQRASLMLCAKGTPKDEAENFVYEAYSLLLEKHGEVWPGAIVKRAKELAIDSFRKTASGQKAKQSIKAQEAWSQNSYSLADIRVAASFRENAIDSLKVKVDSSESPHAKHEALSELGDIVAVTLGEELRASHHERKQDLAEVDSRARTEWIVKHLEQDFEYLGWLDVKLKCQELHDDYKKLGDIRKTLALRGKLTKSSYVDLSPPPTGMTGQTLDDILSARARLFCLQTPHSSEIELAFAVDELRSVLERGMEEIVVLASKLYPEANIGKSGRPGNACDLRLRVHLVDLGFSHREINAARSMSPRIQTLIDAKAGSTAREAIARGRRKRSE